MIAKIETTFEWSHHRRLHLITSGPPTASELAMVQAALVFADRAGLLADWLALTFGRPVRVHWPEPSPDVWFEVGL